jgi:hypothetical protein
MTDPRIAAARERAFLLYEGRRVPHRSCGIALAETFGLATPAYQAFRKGGITGEGPCGSIQAGAAILGEMFGDPDPRGATTPVLRAAMQDYQRLWRERMFGGAGAPDTVCNHLTAPHGEFGGEKRLSFCTNLAATVAAIVAEVAIRHGYDVRIPPLTV